MQENDLEEAKGSLQLVNYAMNYGTALGFFWVFKYIFLIADFDSTYSILSTMGTPLVLFYLVARYRDKACAGQISYGHTVLFSTVLCFFGSLFEMVVAYLHYTVIEPSYISDVNTQMLLYLKNMNLSESVMQQMKDFSPGSLYYAISLWIGNIILGLFLSLIYGFIISKKDKLQ